MEMESDYVNHFLKYIQTFVSNIRSDDPLPVRAPHYKVTESEIDGQIIDIVYHYLSSRECPPYIRSLVAHRVWSAIRQPDANLVDEDGCEVIDHGNQTFEPMKLIQDVTNKVNAELTELKKSLTPSMVENFPRYLPVSQYAIKNTRRKMEDRHVIIQDLNTLYGLNYETPHAFYAVYDGHAGSDAAVYSAALLHQYLIQNPMYEFDPACALKHAFQITDTNFIKKEQKERLKGGTTAVVALVRDKRLVVAWLGDSLALLVRNRTPVHIVKPHKPDEPSEQKRIEDAGGYVVHIQGTWRVLGQLAVSRAIGNGSYKPYVSSECDIKSLEICGDEDFLILACDGLWDVISPERAVSLVFSHLMRNEGDTEGVGRCLVEAARVAGSEDNITAVVVFLRAINVLMEEEAARVEQGMVLDVDPLLVPVKGSLPPSINAILTPPEQPSLFTAKCYTNGQSSHISEMVSADDEGPEIPPRDYDMDEAPAVEKNGFGEQSPHPTDEEVDAALAELDSIPDDADELCDDAKDESWSYLRSDGMASTSPGDNLESNSDLRAKTDPVTGSSNPGVVEGFVTSVELNSAEEGFSSSVMVTQSSTANYFGGSNASAVEPNSGPFSVYVSSSPEPASADPSSPVTVAATASQGELPIINPLKTADDTPIPASTTLLPLIETAAVEIVHAQSTVEVITSHPYQLDLNIAHPPEGANTEKPFSTSSISVAGFELTEKGDARSPLTQLPLLSQLSAVDRFDDQSVHDNSLASCNVKLAPYLDGDSTFEEQEERPELEAQVLQSSYAAPNKAFEVSLDPMNASFHEDLTPSSDLVCSLKQAGGPRSNLPGLSEERVEGEDSATDDLHPSVPCEKLALDGDLSRLQDNETRSKIVEDCGQDLPTGGDINLSSKLLSPNHDVENVDDQSERSAVVIPKPFIAAGAEASPPSSSKNSSIQTSRQTSSTKSLHKTSPSKQVVKSNASTSSAATTTTTTAAAAASSTAKSSPGTSLPKSRLVPTTKTSLPAKETKKFVASQKPGLKGPSVRPKSSVSATLPAQQAVPAQRRSEVPLRISKPKAGVPSRVVPSSAKPKTTTTTTTRDDVALGESKQVTTTKTSSSVSHRLAASSSKLAQSSTTRVGLASTSKSAAPGASSKPSFSGGSSRPASSRLTSSKAPLSSTKNFPSTKTSAKDAKDSTNRLLSTASSRPPRNLPSKYSKTPGLRKKVPEKVTGAAGARAVAAAAAPENDKLADEASAVENKEKKKMLLSQNRAADDGHDGDVEGLINGAD